MQALLSTYFLENQHQPRQKLGNLNSQGLTQVGSTSSITHAGHCVEDKLPDEGTGRTVAIRKIPWPDSWLKEVQRGNPGMEVARNRSWPPGMGETGARNLHWRISPETQAISEKPGPGTAQALSQRRDS